MVFDPLAVAETLSSSPAGSVHPGDARRPCADCGRVRRRPGPASDRGPSGSYGCTSIAPANVTRAGVACPLAALPGGMATMRSWIDHAGEVVWEPAPSLIAQLIEAGQPFWLDIENPTDEIIGQLATRLGLHPLAAEDSKQFGQRAKLQVYGTQPCSSASASMSSCARPSKGTDYYTTGFLITMRRAPSPALDALRQAGSVRPQLASDPIGALHPLISSLYTQFSALALEAGPTAGYARAAGAARGRRSGAGRDHRDTAPRRGHPEDHHTRPGPRGPHAADPVPARRQQRNPAVRRRHQRPAAASRGRVRRVEGDVPPCWSCTPRSQASTWRS